MTDEQLKGYGKQIAEAIMWKMPIGDGNYAQGVALNEQTCEALAEIIDRMISQRLAALGLE